MAKRGRQAKYPRFTAQIPAHLVARRQAASTVLGVPVDELLEKALATYREGLQIDDTKRELIDRFASETLVRTERE